MPPVASPGSEPRRSDAHTIERLMAIAFVGGLGGGVVFPILPVEGLRLGISAALVGLILSMNRIVRLGVNSFTGALVDRLGPRLPLAAGLLVEALSTLCFSAGMHSDAPARWFLAGRAAWGVGSSLLMVGAMTAALLFSTESNRGTASARVRMGLSLGVPGGLILGGVIANFASATAAFFAAAAITFAGMVAALIWLPRRPRAVGGAVRRRTRGGWRALREVLRPGPLWLVWAFNFVAAFAVQGVILASLALLVEERRLSIAGLGAEGTSGILMAAMIATSAVVALRVGGWLDRRRRRTGLLLPAALLLAAGFVALALAPGSAVAAAGLCLIGVAVGAINISLMVILGDLAHPERYGRTVGVYQVLGDLGGSLGPVLGVAATHRYGSRPTLLAVAATLVVTLPLGLGLRLRDRRRAEPG